MQRINIRRQPTGKKPTWKFSQKTSVFVQNAKVESIDWYQYGRVILMKKLISFAKECTKERPGIIVQEDNTLAHIYPT